MATDLASQAPGVRAIQELVQVTARLLDEENFQEWLKLFDSGAYYELRAHSTEIRQDMSWWKSDRAALEKIIDEISRHVRDPARRLHIVSPPLLYTSSGQVLGISNFAIFRTTPDGVTTVYAVGYYEDSFVERDSGWMYSVHKAVLHTRLLEVPTHVPL